MVSPTFTETSPVDNSPMPPAADTDALNTEPYSDPAPEIDASVQDAPLEQGTPPPAPPAFDPAVIQKELEDLRQWKAQQEQERQQAQAQQAAQQKEQAYQAFIQQQAKPILESLQGLVPPEQAQSIAQRAAAAAYLGTPEGVAHFGEEYLRSPIYQQTQHFQHVMTMAYADHANRLIEQHLGPQTTLATAKQVRAELLAIKDPAAMEAVAKRIAAERRQNNARDRASSQAERTEGVGDSFINTGNPLTRYREALRQGQPLPSSQEIDRLTRQYLRP